MEHEVFIPVPAETLREALRDHARVARCVPGLQQDAEESARPLSGRLKVRVGGHAITYRGALTLTERAGGFTAEGQGAEVRGTGSATARVRVVLAETAGGTTLTFTATSTADGRLADIAPELSESAGRRLLDRFASALGAGGDTGTSRADAVAGTGTAAGTDQGATGATDVTGADGGSGAASGEGPPPGPGGGGASDTGSGASRGGGDGDVNPAGGGTSGRAPGAGAGVPGGDADGAPTGAEATGAPDEAGGAGGPGGAEAGASGGAASGGSGGPVESSRVPGSDSPGESGRPGPGRSADGGSADPDETDGSGGAGEAEAGADGGAGGSATGEDSSGDADLAGPDGDFGGGEFDVPLSPSELDPSVGFGATVSGEGDFLVPLDPPAEAAHARRTMIGRSAEEVDHAPPRGRYAPEQAPDASGPGVALRWVAPAAALAIAGAVVVGRALRRRR